MSRLPDLIPEKEVPGQVPVLSYEQLRAARRAAAIEHYKIGKRVFYTLDQIARYLDSCRRCPTEKDCSTSRTYTQNLKTAVFCVFRCARVCFMRGTGGDVPRTRRELHPHCTHREDR